MPQTRLDYQYNGQQGGVEGFLNDLFGTEERGDYQGRLKQYLEAYNQRQAPQLGAAQTASASGFAANQGDLIRRLEALSQGRGPSLAAQQMKMATDRNQAGAASLAAGGRGNPALAGIQASNMSGQLGAQAAGQAAAARIQEQQMALSQLGGTLNQARTRDEGLSQFNALQQNYRDQANLEAKLRTMGMNDGQIAAILGQLGQAAYQPTTAERGMAGAAGLAGMGISAWGNKK